MEPNYYITNKDISGVQKIEISGENLVQGSGQQSVVVIPSNSQDKAYFYQFQADRLYKMSLHFQTIYGKSQPRDIAEQADLITI